MSDPVTVPLSAAQRSTILALTQRRAAVERELALYMSAIIDAHDLTGTYTLGLMTEDGMTLLQENGTCPSDS